MMEENHQDQAGNKVGIIGLGFVGLPLALAFVHRGFEVVGIDLDAAKINQLQAGKSYILDIEDAAVSQAISSKRLTVSGDYALLGQVESILICVPTPLSPQHTPDLSYLTSTCNRLVPLLKQGQLIVLESSTFPGTTKEVVQPILERSGLRAGQEMFLAYSPERIDPGNKQLAIEQIPKVVSGVTKPCLERVYALYDQVFAQVVAVSSTETAETVKLLENTYRLVNISFMNEFAQMCDIMHVNVWEVIDAASTKPYGFTPFYPGPGVGGHCIPVDPLYLQWKAKLFGMESQFIALAHRINEAMPNYMVSRLQSLLSPAKALLETTILVYGVTYKKDIPDTRESTAMDLIRVLLQKGAKVRYHDPLIPSLQLDGTTMNSVELTEETLKQVDCVLIHTDHSGIPIDFLMNHAPMVMDTRNVTRSVQGSAKLIKLGGGLA